MRILLLLVLFLSSPAFSHAQLGDEIFYEAQSGLVLQPEYPAPFETYTVTLNDYSTNFYGAQVSWYLNNRLLSDSENQRSLTLQAPDVGFVDSLKVVLTAPGGATQTVTAAIKPVYADIIVEPQTHVPDFYTGRALPSVGSTVNLTALINGSAANAAQRIYTWKVNNVVLESGPLRGRNEISFSMPQDRVSVISLQISDLSGAIIAKRALSISSALPKLLFYEVSTLYGIERRALGKSFSLIGSSATLRAEPFYLSSKIFNNPNILTWKVANTEIATPSNNPYEVTLQKTGFPGITDIGFHVRSTDIILQGVEKSISVSI